MIRNPHINLVPLNVLLELKNLLKKKIPLNMLLTSNRGTHVENMVANHMKSKKISGFNLNSGIGKDCHYFEIKSLVYNKSLFPRQEISVSGLACDRDVKYANSNFKEKAKLILFVCLDTKGSIVDIRFSNFTQSELGIAYYGGNDMLLKTPSQKKFIFRKKYFKSHSISINDVINEIALDKNSGFTFTEWLDALRLLRYTKQKLTFSQWLKSDWKTC